MQSNIFKQRKKYWDKIKNKEVQPKNLLVWIEIETYKSICFLGFKVSIFTVVTFKTSITYTLVKLVVLWFSFNIRYWANEYANLNKLVLLCHNNPIFALKNSEPLLGLPTFNRLLIHLFLQNDILEWTKL